MNYIPYKSLSKNPENDSYIFTDLSKSLEIGFNSIPPLIRDNFDQFVLEKLKYKDMDEMFSVFSAEQIDAIGLAILNIEKNSNIIIADETGKGKGRILSGIMRYLSIIKIKTIFFTEGSHLFSDIYRDITNTNSCDIIGEVLLFHSKAKLFDTNGNLIKKSTKNDIDKLLKSKIPISNNLILTTYSQINYKETKKDKFNFFSKIAKNAVVILDESHNAAGQSNTQKFIEDLLEKSRSAVFSSATFIKNENELALYNKVFNYKSDEIKLFIDILNKENNYDLRKNLTYELGKNLKFIRREHKPENISWEHIYVSENVQETVNHYSAIINRMFKLLELIGREPTMTQINHRNIWYSMGALINRLSKNLLLLLKLNTLIIEVQKCVQNNKKAVIVMESTFNALILKAIEYEENITSSIPINTETETDKDENESIEINEKKIYKKICFNSILYWIKNKVIDENLSSVFKNKNIFTLSDELNSQIADFPPLFLSPIDQIKSSLNKIGIKVGEISGRTYNIIENGDGHSMLPIGDNNKNVTVKKFNDGEIDVVVITRAGASGISLHSDKKFKDQKQRELFELEITTRPTFRLQFIGRVRRKNQASEPNFYTISTKLPFERRILNIENIKLKTLQSHISGDETKLDNENIFDFYTTESNLIAKQFLESNPQIAFKLGISLKENNERYYFIDSLLKRSIILTEEQQEKVFTFLINGIELQNIINKNKNKEIIISKISNIKTFWHNLNDLEQQQFKKEFVNNKNESLNQFKYPWVCFVDGESEITIEKVDANDLRQILDRNQDNNKFINHFHNVIKYYQNQFLYSRYLTEKVIIAKNINAINKAKIGNYIELDYKNEKIFGYIEDIIYKEDFTNFYPTHYLFNIRLINPTINPGIGNTNTNFYINLHELLINTGLKIKNNENIDFNKFTRLASKIIKTRNFLMGHPLWAHFIMQSYKIGESKTVQILDKKMLVVELPTKFNYLEIKKYKKPIFSANNIMHKIIHESVSFLTTTYDGAKPAMKLDRVTGGYSLFVQKEITYDKNIFDYPLHNKLGTFKSDIDYFIYFIPYKNLRSILFLLEKRGIIWFI